MNLEEMQAVWSEMSDQLEKQKKLTDKMIIKMTKQDYSNRINKIMYPELLGTVICFLMAGFIIFNYKNLDTTPVIISAILTAGICIVLPILSIRALLQMKNVSIEKNNFKQTLIDFTKGKKRLIVVQKVGFYLSFILMIVCLPVFSKLFGNKDLFSESNVWYWYVPFGVAFLLLFSRWVFKHYKKAMQQAGSVLEELKDEQ